MGIKLAASVISLLVVASGTAWPQDVFTRSRFNLQIESVQSIAPEKRLGFSRSLEAYSVTASGPEMSYVLYCTKGAPQTGRVYTAADAYVVSDLSFLHLWPVERSTLDLPPGASKRGRLYRVIIIQDVATGKRPDLACDIHSERARQAKP